MRQDGLRVVQEERKAREKSHPLRNLQGLLDRHEDHADIRQCPQDTIGRLDPGYTPGLSVIQIEVTETIQSQQEVVEILYLAQRRECGFNILCCMSRDEVS